MICNGCIDFQDNLWGEDHKPDYVLVPEHWGSKTPTVAADEPVASNRHFTDQAAEFPLPGNTSHTVVSQANKMFAIYINNTDGLLL